MKVGVIGLGFMGATHLRAYNKLANAEVSVVCARDSRKLSDTLMDSGGNLNLPSEPIDLSNARKTTEWQDVVNDAGIDAIDICVPSNLHSSIAVAALNAGKHVLCEKPMSLTPGECEEMMAAAQRSARVLMIGHVLRFWPEYQALSRYVRSGELGAVRSACFTRRCGVPDWSSWLPEKRQSGGALLDLLIHDIDQALYLFGKPRHVSALQNGEVDSVVAQFKYDENLSVQIQGGWLAPGTPFSMGFDVVLEGGRIRWSGAEFSVLFGADGWRNVEIRGNDAYEAEISYFVDCCTSGQKAERCPPKQSAEAVEVALLLDRSRAHEGETIACSV